MKQSILFFQRISLLLSAVLLLAGCSGSDSEEQEKGGGSQPEIRLTADSWQVMSGTRVTTFDNPTALQTEGTFTCYAYNHGTSTVYEPVNNKTATWNSSYWSIEGRPTWPESDYLDFFAYMPATKPDYITSGPAYSYSGEPGHQQISFESTLPLTSGGQSDKKEFIFALVESQNKDNAGSGVTLTFKHPFARVYFKKADGLTGVTINSVTIAGIKNNGSCTFDGTTTTWTPSGEATNLVVSGSPATGDTPYLVLPQTFDSNLTFTVNATWTSWSNVTKNVSTTVAVGTWAPGTSYTYTFNLKGEVLIVDTQKYTEQW